ncbi:hypothetical protein GcM1_164013 [Golovinomyces cichoracearum]|uniref:Uncharacterized protein n=1 Tax=Golovinomyces cichoracearum TaxID=62708 RepID=A0A420J8A3_9PEZI|nr:hypothetical protein GcM1_164013 [Golovinomyces cichoracearum]
MSDDDWPIAWNSKSKVSATEDFVFNSSSQVISIPPSNYKPQRRDPTDKFAGDAPETCDIWRYEVEQKFKDDSVLFKSVKQKIAYVRAQLKGEAFSHISHWKITTSIPDQTVKTLFRELEFFCGATDLDELARSTLLHIRHKSG